MTLNYANALAILQDLSIHYILSATDELSTLFLFGKMTVCSSRYSNQSNLVLRMYRMPKLNNPNTDSESNKSQLLAELAFG